VNEILIGVLEDFLGKSSGELAKALKELPEESQSKTLKKLVADKSKEIFIEGKTEGKGFGKKTALEAKEAEIAEKYQIEADKLDKMIDQIVAKKAEEFKSEELTAEEIRQTDVYKKDIEKLQGTLQTLESEKNRLSGKYFDRTISSELNPVIDQVLKDENFIVPESQSVRRNLKSLLIQELRNNSRAEMSIESDSDSERIVIIDKKEKGPLRDDNLKPISLNSYVARYAGNYFEKAKADDRKGGGGKGGSGSRNTGLVTFKDVNDFRDQLKAAKSSEERAKLKEQYKQQKEN